MTALRPSYRRKKLEEAEKGLFKLMTAAKSSYESQLVDLYAFNNSYRIFKYIKSIMKTDSLPAAMYLEDKSATSDLDKAMLFNSFFESVYSKDNVSLDPTSIPQSSQPESLDFINITELDVYAALSNLDPTKACGIDGIGPKVLRSCALSLYQVIHHLFSICLWYCDIPSDWKLHSIIPIYKSGDKSVISNYRPISLLCSMSKVLERLVYDKVFVFIHRSVSKFQFGFLRSHSCLQQLLIFVSKVFDSFGDNCQMDSVYLDFKKAFDKVPHFALLSKLSHIGISGRLLTWFHNYLTDRKQLVSINGTRSSVLPVSSGVPQGSILGPLLFLVYINDLPDAITSCNIFLFADDTKCCQSIKTLSDCSRLQHCVDVLQDWSIKWNLHFNDSKCMLVQFRKPCNTIVSHSYKIGDHTIATRDSHRDLGIILQYNLSWADHYDHICSKAYKILGLLRRSFFMSHSKATKRKLYISLVRSQLTYCSQLWRPALIKDIRKLEQIQRRATRYILGTTHPHPDYKQRLIALNLLPLMYYFEIADIMFMVNSLKNPTDRFNILNYVQIQTSNTRSSDKLTLQHVRCCTNQQHHFYFNRIPRLWNKLPSIDLDSTVETIKTKVYKVLWSHFIDMFDSDNVCSFHFFCPCGRCS